MTYTSFFPQPAWMVSACLCALTTLPLSAQESTTPPVAPPPANPEAVVTPADTPPPPPLFFETPLDPVGGIPSRMLEVDWQAGQTRAVEGATTIPEAEKPQILEILKEINSLLPLVRTIREKVAEHDKAIAEAPGLLEATRKAIEDGEKPAIPPLQESDTSDQVQTLITQMEADLATANARLDSLRQVPEIRNNRVKEIPSRISRAKEAQEEIDTALSATPPANQSPALQKANRFLLNLRRMKTLGDILALEKESQSYAATDNLVTARIDRARKQVAGIESALKELRERYTVLKQREDDLAARRAAEALNSELLTQYTELRTMAEDNRRLVDLRVQLGDALESIETDMENSSERLERLKGKFETTRKQVSAIEDSQSQLYNAIGLTLRRENENLTQINQYLNRVRERDIDIASLSVMRIELVDQREEFLSTSDAFLERVTREIDADSLFQSSYKNRTAKAQARQIVEARKEAFDELLESYAEVSDALIQLNQVEEELARTVGEFREFIAERVLWIRSGGLISLEEIQNEWEMISQLGSVERGREIGVVLKQSVIRAPYRSALNFLFVFVFLILQRPIRKKIQAYGEIASQRSHTEFRVTVFTFFLTLLASLPIPIVFWFAGNQLLQVSVEYSFQNAFANGLIRSAVWLLLLTFVLKMTRPRSLATVHLNWPAKNVNLIRKHTRWYLPVSVLLTLVVLYVEGYDNERVHARLTFLLWMLFSALYLYLLLHPARGIAPERDPKQKSHRYWPKLRFLAGVALPLGLLVASLIGYHYTAMQISVRLYASISLIVVASILSALVLNWIFLTRRKIAHQLAIERRQRQQAQEEEGGEADSRTGEEEENIDWGEVRDQTQTLLRTGMFFGLAFALWSIWSDVLPALNALDRVQLWTVEVAVDPSDEAEAGSLASSLANGMQGGRGETAAPAIGPQTRLEPITLADVFLAILILVILYIASSNLSGVLNVTVYRLIKMNPGSYYATTTVLKYVITFVAFLLAFQMIGITWGTVQWLAAAISLGIGFGLQEIVANFVSGLILLFERPIRVGDVVTAGDVTGRVTRIRIRATTITDWDNKELIVPNRELITARVLNWTLTEARVRMVILVGVAYGSDVRKATRVLLALCAQDDRILKDPAPSVTFDNFGDSTLNLILRLHLPNLDNMLAVRHEMHLRIDDEFRKEGIEIAFPQRDIHVRSVTSALPGVVPVDASGQEIPAK